MTLSPTILFTPKGIQEVLYKTVNHEEPDKVPSFEGSIDNLKVCVHFKVKYGYQGSGDLLIKTYDLLKGDAKLLKKFVDKSNKVLDILTPAIELYKCAQIDLCPIYLTNLPVFYEREGIIDDYGRRMHFKKNPSDGMDILYYIEGTFNNIDDFENFPQMDPHDPKRENIFRSAKQIEENFKGKVYNVPTIGGIFEGSWQCFGLNKFSRFFSQPKILR